MQDVVNTCVKMEIYKSKNKKTNAQKILMSKTQRSHQDAVNRTKIWNYTKSNKITLRRKILAKWRKSYQDAVNHTKIANDTKRNKISVKRKLYPKRRKIIPRFGWLHQGVKCHQDKQNHTKTKISSKTEKKNHTKIHVTTIKWWRQTSRDRLSE